MGYRTKLDYSDNRQISQREKTDTILSGATVFGLPFSGLTVGPDLTTSGVTEVYGSVVSTFSGNSTTTNYNWYDSRMALAAGTLSAITPSTSAITQETDYVFTGNSSITVDGNTSYLDYSGTFFSVIANYVVDLGGGNYSGTVQHDELIFLSANSLDYSGRTIWIDNPEITRTDRLIISRDAQPDYVWTSINSEGMGEWRPVSGITSGDTLSQVLSNGNSASTYNIVFDQINYGLYNEYDTGFVLNTHRVYFDTDGVQMYATNDSTTAESVIKAKNDGAIYIYADSPSTFNFRDTIFINGVMGWAGMQYDNDYSANFTDYSLITKGYLNNQITGSTLKWYAEPLTAPTTLPVVSGTASIAIGDNAKALGDYQFVVGNNVGYGATGTTYTNFIGNNVGNNANDAYNSNFIGYAAGNNANDATYCNFIGNQAGIAASGTTYSNFIGGSAGYYSNNANFSNFIGVSAGYNASNSTNSNFIGRNAGQNANGVIHSNFIGANAGQNANGVTHSNFIGASAGNNASGNSKTNYIGYFAGYSASNSFDSNFIGTQAGYNATGSTFSNFIGYFAGQNASGTTYSNYMGYYAGFNADDNANVNFIGTQAGVNASGSSNSNYFGNSAGYNATDNTFSNFIGDNVGNNATNSDYSNFIGNSTGVNAHNNINSNFIGTSAGRNAYNSSSSNFIGTQAGYNTSGITYSNFIGTSAGQNTTGTTYSNYMGYYAGYNADDNINVNFIGREAGYLSSSNLNSNFIGNSAGYNASNSTNSNFIGRNAGFNGDNSSYSNFMGHSAGYNANNSNYSNFIGRNAGNGASGSTLSNFIGDYAGYNADDNINVNFIGRNTGYNVTGVTSSNFIGFNSGRYAYGTNTSNFIGYFAGDNASGNTHTNFIGSSAGVNSYDNSQSNFIGTSAGTDVNNLINSNFIGSAAGAGGDNSSHSNFMGYYAGYNASGSTFSNFIGSSAGYNATGSSYSILIGTQAGLGNSTVGYIGNNNIIIGTNISLPNAKQNSLNIGGVLFGTGLYSTVGGSPYTTGFTGGKIGILTADPTETLDVDGNGRFRVIGSSASAGALHYTSDGTLTTNTSDERLKTNIQPLTNALNKVKQLRGVTYNWLENPSGDTRIGFIAQEVNSVIPELTFVNKNSEEQYMGVHYDNTVALLVEAVKELSTGSTLIETQTILAEDNNIELNYNGTHDSAINGGIIVTKGVDDETNSEFVTNVNGDFISNVNLIPKGLVIPEYTPTSSLDTNGIVGNFTRDENYLYIKGNNGWKRVNLESF